MRLFSILGGSAIMLATAGTVFAETTVRSSERLLFDALLQPEVIEIMAEEGRVIGEQIAIDLFPDRDPAAWQATLADIYDEDWMEDRVFADFVDALEGSDVDAMLAFYESGLGAQSVRYETDARRAFSDKDIEDAAYRAADMATGSYRQERLTDLLDANDIIEQNVAYGLSDNYAFFLGLLDGGALDGQTTQDMILEDVWAQEDEIRTETLRWMLAFLTVAYDPLTDEDLEELIAFARTDAGQGVNRALFVAYDQLYQDISRMLGLQAAQMMKLSEL